MMNVTVNKIGELSVFCAKKLGYGQFGTVFSGKFTGVDEEVAIKRMEKRKKVHIDANVYHRANGQQHLIYYYGIELSPKDEFMSVISNFKSSSNNCRII